MRCHLQEIWYAHRTKLRKQVTGEYTNAKIFSNMGQEAAVEQIKELCNQPFMKGAKVRIMLNYHVEKRR